MNSPRKGPARKLFPSDDGIAKAMAPIVLKQIDLSRVPFY